MTDTPDTTPEPYPSESAAVQAWIDGEAVTCRCGRLLTRPAGWWLHIGDGMATCENGRDAGPSIADSECGTCHRTWDSVVTPTPAARCPYEYDHEDIANATRLAHYTAVYAEVEDEGGIHDDDDVPPPGALVAPIPQWCLIERDADHGSRRYVSFFDDRDEAGRHHYGQEYPNDWTIEYLFDLDTGDLWEENGVTVMWCRTNAGTPDATP